MCHHHIRVSPSEQHQKPKHFAPNAHQCSMNRNWINADYYINWARGPWNRLCIHIRCLLFTVYCSLFTKYIYILLGVFKIEMEAVSVSVRTIISSTFNLIIIFDVFTVHRSQFTSHWFRFRFTFKFKLNWKN